MKFDEILSRIGEIGPYQIMVIGLVSLFMIPESFQSMLVVFVTADLDHWCAEEEWSSSVDSCTYLQDTDDYLRCIHQFRNASIPTDVVEGEIVYSKCSKYVTEYGHEYSEGDYGDNDVIDCDDGWVYDHSQYRSTIVSDFDLVCSHGHLPKISQSAFYFGYLVGAWLSGSVADIIGRRKTLLIFVILDFTAGMIISFSPSFWFFCLFRFIVGVTNLPIYTLGFVICTEILGPSKRVYGGITIPAAFAVGYMILALLAFFIRDWRTLQRVTSSFLLPCIMIMPIIPESARWLMATQQFTSTEKILKKIAKSNKTIDKLPNTLIEDLKNEQTKVSKQRTPTCIDLFRTRNIRATTVIFFFIWSVTTLVYFGLSLNTAKLGSNDYVTFFLSGAAEIPAALIVIPLVESRLGRRYTNGLALVIAGVCCLITIKAPGTWKTVFAMTGKMCITLGLDTMYIYTTEIFPTVIRAIGLGTCSTAGRVGSIMAPLMLIVGDLLWEPFPFFVSGVLAVVAGFLLLLVIETRGKQMADTIEDGEEYLSKKGQRRPESKTSSSEGGIC